MNLELSLGCDPVDLMDVFPIVQNQGVSDGTGARHFAFAGMELTEGAIFSAGAQEFQITCAGGAGRDVVLHAVPARLRGLDPEIGYFRPFDAQEPAIFWFFAEFRGIGRLSGLV